MRFDWDNDKSQLLQENRGYSLDEIAVVLAGEYVEQIKRDNPEQFIAIGYLEKRFYPLSMKFVTMKMANMFG